MKKTLKRILCLTLVLSMVLCFAACGKEEEDVTGRYDLVSMYGEDGGVAMEDMVALLGEDFEMYIELKDDGTAVMNIYGETMDLEWQDGQIWPAEEPDSKAPFTVEGTALTIEEESLTLVFEKSK